MNFKKIVKNAVYAGIFLLAVSPVAACQKKVNPKIQAEMENGDTFVIELYPEMAPVTVDNFVELVKGGFYDGLTFHRVVDAFMAQGGGYDADGVKKEAATIKGEFANNGYAKNTLKHTKGVISMARIGGQNNSASSEFFIMLADGQNVPGRGYVSHGSFLDGDYAAFGKVIEGMEIIEKFQEIDRVIGFDREISQPVEPLIIKKMTVLD